MFQENEITLIFQVIDDHLVLGYKEKSYFMIWKDKIKVWILRMSLYQLNI